MLLLFLLFFVLLFSLVLTPPFFFFFFWFFFYSWRDVKGSLTVYTPLNPAAVSVFVVRSFFFTPQWHVQCSASLSLLTFLMHPFYFWTISDIYSVKFVSSFQCPLKLYRHWCSWDDERSWKLPFFSRFSSFKSISAKVRLVYRYYGP